jgi:hypothetical protein
LSEEDRRNIDLACPDKLKIVEDLAKLAEISKQRCMDKRWRYIRKSGETVILRDLSRSSSSGSMYSKRREIWQYNTTQCMLHFPGPGCNFYYRLVVLECSESISKLEKIAVNDHAKFGFIVESIASIAESIFRCAAVEALYPLTSSVAARALERALVHLYTAILVYLSKAKSYFEQNSASWSIRQPLRRDADASKQSASSKTGSLAIEIWKDISKPSIKGKRMLTGAQHLWIETVSPTPIAFLICAEFPNL